MCPDHLINGAEQFMTGTDLLGIVGIVGTLLGAIIGSFITWKIQERQIKYENTIRFHNEKLEFYADYVDALNQARTECRIYKVINDDTYGLMHETFARMSLLAPISIVDLLSRVNDILIAFQEGKKKDSPHLELTALQVQIIEKMRKDLNLLNLPKK